MVAPYFCAVIQTSPSVRCTYGIGSGLKLDYCLVEFREEVSAFRVQDFTRV